VITTPATPIHQGGVQLGARGVRPKRA